MNKKSQYNSFGVENDEPNTLTLGELIGKVEKLDNSKPIELIRRPKSYRGRYEELSFDINKKSQTTIDATLTLLRGCEGKKFTGYKGGRFVMGLDTPIWNDPHNLANERKIVDVQLNNNGYYEFITID